MAQIGRKPLPLDKRKALVDKLQADVGSVAASNVSGGFEEELWLIPIEDRRRLDSQREGILETFTLGNYLKLMDYTGRLLRDGKASIDAELADILTRIGSCGSLAGADAAAQRRSPAGAFYQRQPRATQGS